MESGRVQHGRYISLPLKVIFWCKFNKRALSLALLKHFILGELSFKEKRDKTINGSSEEDEVSGFFVLSHL